MSTAAESGSTFIGWPQSPTRLHPHYEEPGHPSLDVPITHPPAFIATI